MIRATAEAPALALFRDPVRLAQLATVECLTTARYEPASRNTLGSGIVDLLFETAERSYVIAGIRLEPNNLIIRERSPFVWPAHVAQTLPAQRLVALERHVVPWLRSITRARSNAHESIRRYVRSARFDRARDAELLGAAPLAQVMRRMAPFVYARRFAAGRHVALACFDDALARAVLADVAGFLESAEPDGGACEARAFAAAWYGIEAPGTIAERRREPLIAESRPDVLVADDWRAGQAAVVVTTSVEAGWTGAAIEVPAPVPLDILFSFDTADAPAVARFGVRAPEPELRPCPAFERPAVAGGSSGRIVLAQSADARAQRGDDAAEIASFARCLRDEGFGVDIVADAADPRISAAQLVHVFGSLADAQTAAFAQTARERGIDYVLDIAPLPETPSAYVEEMLVCALRSAADDAERGRYLRAYEERRASGDIAPEPSAEEFARLEERVLGLAAGAVAVLAVAEDVAALRARLTPEMAPYVFERGVFASPEPEPEPIGHLVPARPFALVHGPIAARSHALFAAHAAALAALPLVVAGPCYDIDYLHALRMAAPAAVVLADPADGVIAALYRRAAIWIDAAPRPRSAAGLVRAAACGALPVLAAESPLSRIAGPQIPVFALTSFAGCAAAVLAALGAAGNGDGMVELADRLAPRRSLARTFGQAIAAYSRIAARAT